MEVVKIELNHRAGDEYVFEVTWEDGSKGLLVLTIPRGQVEVSYSSLK